MGGRELKEKKEGGGCQKPTLKRDLNVRISLEYSLPPQPRRSELILLE